MTSAILQFAASAGVIIIAGTVLTRSGDAMATLTGLGRLLVGSVLVAGATSLPELLTGIHAVRSEGLPDLAVGNILGSSIMNLLILAGIDFAWRSRGRMFSPMSAAHALSATMTILLTGLVGLALVVPLRHELLGIGAGLWVVGISYLLGIRLTFFDRRYAKEVAEAEEPPPSIFGKELTLGLAIALFALAAAVIFVAAPHLASSAATIAEVTGIGSTFIGSTLVALATSLPELVATIAAVRIGAPDIALGNIFGSNAFNMVLLLPIDLAHPGLLLADASPTHAITAFAIIAVTSIAMLGILYRAEKRILFLEPDAALVVLLSLLALVLLYFVRPEA